MNQARRQYYLNAMGIQNWQLKSAEDVFYTEEDVLDTGVISRQQAKQDVVSINVPAEKIKAPKTQVINADLNRVQPEIETPKVDVPKVQTHKAEIPKVEIPDAVSKNKPPERQVVSFAVPPSNLERSIKECKLCTSRQSRLNALTGLGTIDANVFVISEPPSAEEDRNGHYLNEQTGAILQSMFQCIDVHEVFFLTGIIKCFSQTDYLYSEEEVTHCAQFLYAQIEQIKPQVILVWGAAQAQAILHTKQSFNQLRGQIHQATINDQTYSLVVSYHPAYLLRNPLYKREALNDLIMLKQLLND